MSATDGVPGLLEIGREGFWVQGLDPLHSLGRGEGGG